MRRVYVDQSYKRGGDGGDRRDEGDGRQGKSSGDRRREFDLMRDQMEEGNASSLRRTSEGLDTEIDRRGEDENGLNDTRNILDRQYGRIIDPNNEIIPDGSRYEQARSQFNNEVSLYNARIRDLSLRIQNYNTNAATHNAHILNRDRDEVDYFGVDDIPERIESVPSYNDSMRQREAAIRTNFGSGGGYGGSGSGGGYGGSGSGGGYRR